MLKEHIQQLMQKRNLTQKQCEDIVSHIIEGANPHQTAALLALLHAKPETSEEIYNIVCALHSHMIPVDTDQTAIDIVGTGGDGSNSVNISTATSLLIASLGINVTKHGNRAVSSSCGSADILRTFGIKTNLSASQARHMLSELGFTFLYAPNFHPAINNVKEIRQSLGVRTIFNLIGPLLNPAQPKHYLLGVYDKCLLKPFADVLFKLKTKRSLVVHGNGLDELNCIGVNQVIEVTPEGKKSYTLDPKTYGLNYCKLEALQGGNAKLNHQLIMNAFNGEKGPITDTILFNAAVALNIVGFCDSIEKGLSVASSAIEDGKVLSFIEACNRYDQLAMESDHA